MEPLPNGYEYCLLVCMAQVGCSWSLCVRQGSTTDASLTFLVEAWWRRWGNLHQVAVAFRTAIIGFLNFSLLLMDILQQEFQQGH